MVIRPSSLYLNRQVTDLFLKHLKERWNSWRSSRKNSSVNGSYNHPTTLTLSMSLEYERRHFFHSLSIFPDIYIMFSLLITTAGCGLMNELCRWCRLTSGCTCYQNFNNNGWQQHAGKFLQQFSVSQISLEKPFLCQWQQ